MNDATSPAHLCRQGGCRRFIPPSSFTCISHMNSWRNFYFLMAWSWGNRSIFLNILPMITQESTNFSPRNFSIFTFWLSQSFFFRCVAEEAWVQIKRRMTFAIRKIAEEHLGTVVEWIHFQYVWSCRGWSETTLNCLKLIHCCDKYKMCTS